MRSAAHPFAVAGSKRTLSLAMAFAPIFAAVASGQVPAETRPPADAAAAFAAERSAPIISFRRNDSNDPPAPPAGGQNSLRRASPGTSVAPSAPDSPGARYATPLANAAVQPAAATTAAPLPQAMPLSTAAAAEPASSTEVELPGTAVPGDGYNDSPQQFAAAATELEAAATPANDPPRFPTPHAVAPPSAAAPRVDRLAQPTTASAALQADVASDRSSDRRLAPPSAARAPGAPTDAPSRAATGWPAALGPFKSLSSAGAGLAVVIALFLILMSFVRRGGSAPGKGILPDEAFAVLGRAPLTAQSVAQLIRLGNKLVLVAVGADGVQPLAEVTDPVEVDRLAGMCARGAPHGPSAEFQQVLAQLSREPARGFLGREASTARRRT